MSGMEYATPRKSAYPAYIALLLGIAVVIAGALTENYEWLLLAVLPLLMGLLLWRVSRYQVRFRLGPTAIEIEQPKIELPYNEIVAVRRSRWKRSGEILAIASNRWLLELPNVPDFPISEIESLVLARADSLRTHEPPPEMREYFQQQLELFGPNKVAVIPARKQPSSYEIPPARYRRNAIFLSMFIASLIWIPASSMGNGAFAAFAGLMISFSIFGWALSRVVIWNSPKKVPQKLANSCLVFSPQGLAMMQGEYQGVLVWADVHNAVETRKDRSFQFRSRNAGVSVKLTGAELLIDDIYEESPEQIVKRIQQHL